MARNEEKQLGRLNRLLLKNQHDDEQKKNPRRPHLSELHTSVEVKKWFPSIKKDLDFYLKQMQVPCYPDRKIEEFEVHISRLQREYKAFIHKLKELDPDSGVFQEPWIDRPYDQARHKRIRTNEDVVAKKTVKTHLISDKPPSTRQEGCKSESTLQRLSLPVLEGEGEIAYVVEASQPDIMWNCDQSAQNNELEFKTIQSSPMTKNIGNSQEDVKNSHDVHIGSLVEYSSSDSENGS